MRHLMQAYPLTLAGGGLCLLLAGLMVTIGFFKTLLILIFTLLGGGIGWYADRSGLATTIRRKLS